MTSSSNIDLLDRLEIILESLNSDTHLEGLSKDEIDSIPIYLCNSSDFSKCVVCLEGFRKGISKYKELNCGHRFHVRCINKWLKVNKACPHCRDQN